jgi:hypothetical protein
VRLSIDLDSDLRGIAAVAARAGNLRPMLERAADDIQQANTDHIRKARFKPLSAEQARRKARRGLSTRPLLGGELERSVAGRGRFAVRRVDVHEVRVGTKDPVANLHKAGTKRMPARPPVRLTPGLRRLLIQRLTAHVLDDSPR